MATRLSNRQSGFGGVAALIAVVVIVTVGGVGYAVYRHTTATRSADVATTTPVVTPAKPDTGTPSSTKVASDDGKVSLTIPSTWHSIGSKAAIVSNASANGPGCLDVDDPNPCLYSGAFQP